LADEYEPSTGQLLRRILIGAEAKKCSNISGALELPIAGNMSDLDAAVSNGPRDQCVQQVFNFSSLAAADITLPAVAAVEVAAIPAFHTPGGKAVSNEQRLYLSSFERKQHTPKSSYAATITMSLAHNFAHQSFSL
jgi:hypothetical protein